jgi:hypothetical protein
VAEPFPLVPASLAVSPGDVPASALTTAGLP